MIREILIFIFLSSILIAEAQTEKSPVSFSLIETSYSYAPEFLVYKGGKLKKRRIIHGSVLIRHPKGNILFDTGLGENIDHEYKEEMSCFGKKLFKYNKVASVKAVLNTSKEDSTIKYIIPSHLHWDHTGGIKDFTGTKILVRADELEEAKNAKNKIGTYFKSNLEGNINWDTIHFSKNKYEIFAESMDIYGDSSLILVSLPGHTCGSVGLFVKVSGGKTYFFSGDLTWTSEAIKKKKPKYFIARKFVDSDPDAVLELIRKVADMQEQKSDLTIVPAHDYNKWHEIGLWPKVVY